MLDRMKIDGKIIDFTKVSAKDNNLSMNPQAQSALDHGFELLGITVTYR